MTTLVAERQVETPLVCSELLAAGSVSPDGILRTFEHLRRELSRKVCGDDGMFAGYDRIVLSRDLAEQTGPVYLRAALLENLGQTHRVEYVAVSYDLVVPWDPRRDRMVLLARGSGRTLRRQT